MKTHKLENNVGQEKTNEDLLEKRTEMLNSIKDKGHFECLFKDNNILKGGENMMKDLKNWNRGQACAICEESWFNQSKQLDAAICDRCQRETPEENIYKFSDGNDMIPGPIPEQLKILNNIEEAAIKLIKPFLHIYKRKGGGVGFSGNCISFAQNIESFTKSLPWSVKELPILVIHSENDKTRTFHANGDKIRNALKWLKDNHPEYKDITINEDTLKEYPENGGELKGIPTLVHQAKKTCKADHQTVNDNEAKKSCEADHESTNNDEAKKTCNADHQSLNDDDTFQDVIDIEDQCDMPIPEGIVFETLKKAEISNMVQEGINEKFDKHVAWPERGKLPESEFSHGWFRKAFPRLFPYGKADFTVSRFIKVNIIQWAQHLLKCDRRFAKDPLFVMVVTNIMQKQQALSLGNIYALKKLSNLTAKEFKDKIESGDQSVLKSMFCFSQTIKGSQQFFSQHISKSVNFIRHIRIESHNTKMFNLFLTFSVADLHERYLHEKLPDSHLYINKKIVKNLNQLPPNSDKEEFIDEKTDYKLRLKAVQENTDIVNEYVIKKVSLLWDHVLKPIFGGEDFIQRFEFQHRGSIHCHMVMSVHNGPSCGDMEFAKMPNIDECETEQDKILTRDINDKIQAAKNKMAQFNSQIIGISAIHPEVDPDKWPAPHGQNIYKPLTNVLRENFVDFKDDPKKLYEHYTMLINRIMLHRCRMGYCLDQKRAKVEKIVGNNGKEITKRTLTCRFKHPMKIEGFDFHADTNGKLQNISPKLDDKGNLEINGSLYQDDTLTMLRNHPDIVTHIPELLVIWGANTDQKIITAYPQLLNYLLKYIMKNETESDFFTNIAKSVISNIDDEAPVRKAAQKILLKSIGQRDKSLNECMLLVHNQPYVLYSRTPRPVSLLPSTRVKKKISIDDEDILCNDEWVDAYSQRDSSDNYQQLCKKYKESPDTFFLRKDPNNISLREFSVKFSKKWMYSQSNVFPNFLPSYRFIVHKGKPHYEEYCKNRLLMDKPGCYIQSVGNSFSSHEEELKDFVENSPFCPNALKTDFQQSQKIVSESKKEKCAEGDAFDELYSENDGQAVNAQKDDWMECFSLGHGDDQNKAQEDYAENDDEEYDMLLENEELNYDWQLDRKELEMTPSKIKDAEGWIDHQKKTFTLALNEQCSVNPESLNAKQSKAYAFLIRFIDSMQCDPENTKPIYLNISGRAGCGKTFFINCVSKYVLDKCGHNFLIKAAPTGTAAFLIGGTTIHSLFRLPLLRGVNKELPDLSHDALKDLQDHFQNCKLLVIDEKSMVGLYMLYAIDKRLREIKCTTSDLVFGGISVILMGDFAQLPPVGDKPLYVANPKDLSLMQGLGKIAFNNFSDTIIFNEIMRQQGDDQKRFREVLDKLSDGTFAKAEWDFLTERTLMDTSKIKDTERKEFLDNATMLCAINKDLTQYNIKRIKLLRNPIAIIKSQNSDSTVASVLATKAQGLPSQIMLAKECKVILTTNLWKEAGLTNGAKGIVKYIVYGAKVKPKALPNIVLVQFPQYIGPSYLKNCNNCVPIVPIKRDWYSGKKHCWRIMLPLKPAYATTIHASQGQSLDRVIIKLGPTEFANGLAYTAITRCKKIEMLSFDPMEACDRFTSIFKHNIFKERRIQDEKEIKQDERFEDGKSLK